MTIIELINHAVSRSDSFISLQRHVHVYRTSHMHMYVRHTPCPFRYIVKLERQYLNSVTFLTLTHMISLYIQCHNMHVTLYNVILSLRYNCNAILCTMPYYNAIHTMSDSYSVIQCHTIIYTYRYIRCHRYDILSLLHCIQPSSFNNINNDYRYMHKFYVVCADRPTATIYILSITDLTDHLI